MLSISRGLAILVFLGILPVEAGSLAIYQLKQATYYETSYFFYAEYRAALFNFVPHLNPDGSRTEGAISNVLVCADDASISMPSAWQNDQQAQAVGGKIWNVPQISVWFDLKGHVHSVATLKRQIEFQKWVAARPACAQGCTLSAGRIATYTIKPIPLTGIMDAQTLRIPLAMLEWRYDFAYRSLLKEAGAAPWDNPAADYWAERLAQARIALNALSNELDAVPVNLPQLPTWRNAWRESSPYNEYGGLERYPPGMYPYSDLKRFWDTHDYALFPKEKEPEDLIERSVDPSAIPQDILERIALVSAESEKKLSQAEALGPPPSETDVVPFKEYK